jgi:hypothetical protein
LAQNPKVYSALGDCIYDNVNNIEKLKEISNYSKFREKINYYVRKVKTVKELGYAVESGDRKNDKIKYLKSIRTLSKINNFFHKNVLDSFILAMRDNDNKLFIQSVNSGLIDTNRYKKEILQYYYKHSEDINSSGVVQRIFPPKFPTNPLPMVT